MESPEGKIGVGLRFSNQFTSLAILY